jgi:hypothetical protein
MSSQAAKAVVASSKSSTEKTLRYISITPSDSCRSVRLPAFSEASKLRKRSAVSLSCYRSLIRLVPDRHLRASRADAIPNASAPSLLVVAEPSSQGQSRCRWRERRLNSRNKRNTRGRRVEKGRRIQNALRVRACCIVYLMNTLCLNRLGFL